MSFRIRDSVSTKDRACIALLGRLAQPVVKAGQHNVVLVQDMHPMTARTLNASVPRIRQASVFGFAMERYSSRSNSVGNFECGIAVRAIVDYLDLHLVRVRVLFEYAPQSLFQIVCPRIVRWYHHRPKRTLLVDRQHADCGRSDTTDRMRCF
jgi:hypothetical protein